LLTIRSAGVGWGSEVYRRVQEPQGAAHLAHVANADGASTLWWVHAPGSHAQMRIDAVVPGVTRRLHVIEVEPVGGAPVPGTPCTVGGRATPVLGTAVVRLESDSRVHIVTFPDATEAVGLHATRLVFCDVETGIVRGSVLVAFALLPGRPREPWRIGQRLTVDALQVALRYLTGGDDVVADLCRGVLGEGRRLRYQPTALKMGPMNEMGDSYVDLWVPRVFERLAHPVPRPGKLLLDCGGLARLLWLLTRLVGVHGARVVSIYELELNRVRPLGGTWNSFPPAFAYHQIVMVDHLVYDPALVFDGADPPTSSPYLPGVLAVGTSTRDYLRHIDVRAYYDRLEWSDVGPRYPDPADHLSWGPAIDRSPGESLAGFGDRLQKMAAATEKPELVANAEHLAWWLGRVRPDSNLRVAQAAFDPDPVLVLVRGTDTFFTRVPKKTIEDPSDVREVPITAMVDKPDGTVPASVSFEQVFQ